MVARATVIVVPPVRNVACCVPLPGFVFSRAPFAAGALARALLYRDAVSKAQGMLGPAARARIKAAIGEIEQLTSAEVVVAVHPASGTYRAAEWLSGVSFAAAWLLVFLYHPASFDFTFLPLELLGAGLVGALLGRTVRPWKRALAGKRTRAAEVERASKVAFLDLGVSRTRARGGLLVFVSLLEREVRIVRDVGVPKLELLATLPQQLSGTLRREDVAAFTRALAELGPALAKRLPRAHDDHNELADEPLAEAS